MVFSCCAWLHPASCGGWFVQRLFAASLKQLVSSFVDVGTRHDGHEGIWVSSQRTSLFDMAPKGAPDLGEWEHSMVTQMVSSSFSLCSSSLSSPASSAVVLMSAFTVRDDRLRRSSSQHFCLVFHPCSSVFGTLAPDLPLKVAFLRRQADEWACALVPWLSTVQKHVTACRVILAGLISPVARLPAESGTAVGGTGPPNDTQEMRSILEAYHGDLVRLLQYCAFLTVWSLRSAVLLDGRHINSDHPVSSASLLQVLSALCVIVAMFTVINMT